MDKELRCECGHVVRASDDESLVEGVRDHALAQHGVVFSVDQVLALAVPIVAGSEDDES